ncbi:MAG: DMT family transporter, partial [Candidatus Cloacimonadaceae bacterium]|nr:DMT family transporter [Candidatus Cloacimonadaceae bacterium]
VPLIGIYRKQQIRINTWFSVLLALGGLYLISNQQSISINFGNALVLVSAVFWALHVQLIDKYTKKIAAFDLAMGQFLICAVLSLFFGVMVKLFQEPAYFANPHTYSMFYAALIPIIYGGIFSVGMAYSLQVYAQKRAEPTAAALILCSESLFALIGGWWILNESLNTSMLACAFVLLVAMIVNLLPARYLLPQLYMQAQKDKV